MRTQEEIKVQIHHNKEDPSLLFDFGSDVLKVYLTFEHVQDTLREGVTQEEWDEARERTGERYTPQEIIDAIVDYLPFAFDKAQDERGLSAMRSQQKLNAWIWLLEDHETTGRVAQADYEPYGLPKLEVMRQVYAPELESA